MLTCKKIIILSALVCHCRSQDYEVADVKCQLYGDSPTKDNFPSTKQQQLTARLKKPEYFRGHPLFADDLKVNPRTDQFCSIVPESNDLANRIYRLSITDLSRCGVTHHSGYVHVRVWFPVLPSAMTSHDQEVILVCKPPESTVLTSKVTSLASSAPTQARVSGVVEESSSKLEYEVAVYRYVDEVKGQRSPTTGRTPVGGPFLVPLDEAVPIGTRLQLRTSINPQSAWKYAKLQEVTVSTDPQDPHADGHVRLLYVGCLTPEMKSLMRGQARRLASKPAEVWLDFEAFLLAPTNYTGLSKRPRREGQQWIHTTVLACLQEDDCRPDVCGDSTDATGFGKRKRSAGDNQTTSEIQFGNRVAIEILPPEEQQSKQHQKANCGIWLVPVGILASTTAASLLLLFITYRWHSKNKKESSELASSVINRQTPSTNGSRLR